MVSKGKNKEIGGEVMFKHISELPTGNSPILFKKKDGSYRLGFNKIDEILVWEEFQDKGTILVNYNKSAFKSTLENMQGASIAELFLNLKNA